MDRSKLVLVQVFGSQGEADLAKSMLDSAGIDSMIQADTAGGMNTAIAWGDLGFRVLVREEDGTDARSVLEPPGQAPSGDLVAVESFPTLHQAEIAKDTLESAGLAAEIHDLTGSATFRLLVRPDDVSTARRLLQPGRKAAT